MGLLFGNSRLLGGHPGLVFENPRLVFGESRLVFEREHLKVPFGARNFSTSKVAITRCTRPRAASSEDSAHVGAIGSALQSLA